MALNGIYSLLSPQQREKLWDRSLRKGSQYIIAAIRLWVIIAFLEPRSCYEYGVTMYRQVPVRFLLKKIGMSSYHPFADAKSQWFQPFLISHLDCNRPIGFILGLQEGKQWGLNIHHMHPAINQLSSVIACTSLRRPRESLCLDLMFASLGSSCRWQGAVVSLISWDMAIVEVVELFVVRSVYCKN